VKKSAVLLFIVAGCLVFLISFGFSSYLFGEVIPLKKIFAGTNAVKGVVYRPEINRLTKIYQETTYLCGNKEKIKIPPDALKGLDYEGLRKRYPAEEGWFIDDSVPNILFLNKRENDYCPQHRDYRHLGIKGGYLAVFQGPLGNDAVLIQKEDVAVTDLPQELRRRLLQAKDFSRLAQKDRQELINTLEFKNDESLNAFLDSLDEYGE